MKTTCCLPYGESKYHDAVKMGAVAMNEHCLENIKIEEEGNDNIIKEFPEDTPDGKIDESRWVEVKNENVLLPCYTCAKCGGETMIRYPFCPYCKRTMTNSTIEPRMNSL